MNCALVRRHFDAYVDGEVDPTTQIEFERHLAGCAECQELLVFERAFRSRVREALGGVRAPAELRARIADALQSAPPLSKVGPGHGASPLIRFLPMPRGAMAVATAAVVVLVFGRLLNDGTDEAGPRQASAFPIFEDVVRVHSSELPADVQGGPPQQVTTYFRNKVEFPVRPALFQGGTARLIGARLSQVRDRRAVALYYDVNGQRVTVVVFDAPTGFERAAVRVRRGGHEIYYQNVHGYTVPVRRHDGLTYAFTGDLDREALLRLAAAAQVRY